jgi:CheY-like chemotaxis protein
VLLPATQPASSPHEHESEPRPVAAERVTAAPEIPLEGVRVLVVDDEPLVLGFAKSALELAGCRVEVAGNGDEALARLEQSQGSVDGMLMDLTMPGRPVHEVIAEIRRRYPAVALLLTSGFGHHSPVREALPELHFLPKPYSPTQLVQALRAVLAGADTRSP